MFIFWLWTWIFLLGLQLNVVHLCANSINHFWLQLPGLMSSEAVESDGLIVALLALKLYVRLFFQFNKFLQNKSCQILLLFELDFFSLPYPINQLSIITVVETFLLHVLYFDLHLYFLALMLEVLWLLLTNTHKWSRCKIRRRVSVLSQRKRTLILMSHTDDWKCDEVSDKSYSVYMV